MSKSEMKSVLIDVNENDVLIVDTPENLQGFYDLIKCDAIEIRHIILGKKELLAVVDEEGMLKEDVRVSMVSGNGTYPELVGNILVCQQDGDEIIGLTPSEVQDVLNNIGCIIYLFSGKPRCNKVLKGELI